MIPKTLSASSLQVASLCMDRWVHEYVDRVPSISNDAAMVGTAVHGGLEEFVKAVFLEKTHAHLDRKQQKEFLVTMYQMSYVQTFGTTDMETETYKDGFDLTLKWFARTDLASKEMIGVESIELKENFSIPYNLPDGTTGEIRFNYLMDRVDQISDTEWEVVDYKSVRVPISPEDLDAKIQARAYALAIQIKHPEATRIAVTFDLLRHEPVTTFFNREDNIAFWRFLCAETQRIVNTERKDIRPTLNAECGFCVKKYSCKLLQSNLAGGGIHSIDLDQSIVLVDQLKAQMKANKRIVDELEEKIMRHAAGTDVLQWESGDGAYEVEINARRVRTFDAHRAADIMGPELFAQMGSMTLGNLEKIIKDESIGNETREQLKSLIKYTNGNPGVKIKPKTKII